MKQLFASADFGLFGLLFFFVIFLGVALWTYSPSRKKDIEALKNIPLHDEDHDDR